MYTISFEISNRCRSRKEIRVHLIFNITINSDLSLYFRLVLFQLPQIFKHSPSINLTLNIKIIKSCVSGLSLFLSQLGLILFILFSPRFVPGPWSRSVVGWGKVHLEMHHMILFSCLSILLAHINSSLLFITLGFVFLLNYFKRLFLLFPSLFPLFSCLSFRFCYYYHYH